MYRRIMVVVDEGSLARKAVDEGLALAQSERAEVLFCHVLPNFVAPMMDMPPMVDTGPEQFRASAAQAAQDILATAARLAGERGVVSDGIIGEGPDAAECISRAAAEHRCDLIVIGSHGRTALQRLVFGSVVTRLITLAPVPVLVCKALDRPPDQPGRHAADLAPPAAGEAANRAPPPAT